MRFAAASAALCATFALAAPFSEEGLTPYAEKLEARQASAAAALPTIKFPYGTWKASKYDAKGDFYIFKNIRFGAAPVGDLRFAKPAPPQPVEGIQDGTKGGTCMQSKMPASLMSIATGGSSSGLGALLGGGGNGSSLLDSIDMGALMSGGDKSSEDCLFLDLYVPAKALTKGAKKLPIINWIYGGAYIIGSKGGPYEASGVMKGAVGNAIFVSGNYRLGSLGFLAGSTMEKEGAPNAGLWDQRAVLEWIQKYADLFGGNANDVSVWGESAGGGSILHHMTAFGGKQRPLFKKAVLQSPAYDVLPDRKGQTEKVFQDFAKLAGCEGKGLACLRALPYSAIRQAEADYFKTIPNGKFGFGPAADGTLVRQVPVLELASGNYQKEVQSVIVSHVNDEAEMFVKDTIKEDAQFTNYVTFTYGTNQQVNKAILNMYPSPGPGARFETQLARMKDVVEKTFTCNTRFVAEALKGKTWHLQYARGSGVHASDISPTFFNPDGSSSPSLLASALGTGSSKPSDPNVARGYQSYLVSHARTGDPNALRLKNSTIAFPKVTLGPALGNVMNVIDTGFELIEDKKNLASDCGFWRDVYAALTLSGGYSPPGAVVKSSLWPASNGSSANFAS